MVIFTAAVGGFKLMGAASVNWAIGADGNFSDPDQLETENKSRDRLVMPRSASCRNALRGGLLTLYLALHDNRKIIN